MTFWNIYDGVVLTLLAACVFFWPTQLISDRTNRWLRISAIALIVVELFVDGPRPQLLTIYFVAALFAVLLVLDRRNSQESSEIRESKESGKKKLVRWVLVLGTGLCVSVAIVSCFLFPRLH